MLLEYWVRHAVVDAHRGLVACGLGRGGHAGAGVVRPFLALAAAPAHDLAGLRLLLVEDDG